MDTITKPRKAPNLEKVQTTIKELVQQTSKEALEVELEEFLGYSRYQHSDSDNYRNGYTSKTIKTISGNVEIEVSRDRIKQPATKCVFCCTSPV